MGSLVMGTSRRHLVRLGLIGILAAFGVADPEDRVCDTELLWKGCRNALPPNDSQRVCLEHYEKERQYKHNYQAPMKHTRDDTAKYGYGLGNQRAADKNAGKRQP